MSYERKPNSGSLWAIPKRRTSRAGKPYDSYGGSALVQCPHCQQVTDYWINSFFNEEKRVYNFNLSPRTDLGEQGYTAPSSASDSPF